MPVCKHCLTEITLTADAEQDLTCPSCGKTIELSDEDSALLEEASSTGVDADNTIPISDPSDSADDSDDGSTHQEIEYEADATIAFGGQADDEPIALGGDEDEIDFSDISGPEVTQAMVSELEDFTLQEDSHASDTGDSANTLPASGEIRHPRPEEQTLAFDLSGSDRADSDQGDSDRSGSDRSGSGAAGSGSGSDRSSDYSREESGTLDYNTDPRSDLMSAPESRSLSGVDSGQTVPQGMLADDNPSQSLKPEGAKYVEHERVHLRTQMVAHEAPDDQAVYEIVGERHAGGMGEVYQTVQRSMNRSIALKRPKHGLKASDNERNGIISEAVITGQLEHPNIIPVHDVGYGIDGVPFYSMKWVEGEEWEKALKEKRLSEDENIEILIKVAQAIAYAHSKNIIHRDLKPANIWLGNFGEVLVMDWGLAARLDGEGDILPSGTPSYMPPETALAFLDMYKIRLTKDRRVPAGTYGDIYLLGGLLFRIVAGRAPHSRGKKNIDCLKNAARNRIVSTKKKGELLSIAYKAMATEPSERHRDVGEFIAELKAYQAHSQSIQIARKASKDLRAATKSLDSSDSDPKAVYRGFSRAEHGYENALELWKGNRHAQRRLEQTRRLYAEAAYAGGDFDLALTRLDPEREEDTQLINDITASQSQRSRRLKLYKTLQYAVAASLLAALTFIGVSVKYRWDAVSAQHDAEEADDAKDAALIERNEAEKAKDNAVLAMKQAEDAKKEALGLRDKAIKAKQEAEEAEMIANSLKDNAVQEKLDAIADKKDALEATKVAEAAALTAKNNEERTNFFVELGSVRNTFNERGGYSAWQNLQTLVNSKPVPTGAEGDVQYLEELSNWKSEATEMSPASGSKSWIATSDGQHLAYVTSNEPSLSVYSLADLNNPIWSVQLPEKPSKVAMAPSGEAAAVVCNGQVALCSRGGCTVLDPDSEAGKATGEATCVAISTDSAQLIVGDAKTGVTEWDIMSPAQPIFVGRSDTQHGSPIVAVGYSPDGAYRFTAEKAGEIRVYSGQQSWPYNHAQAAYSTIELTAVAMAPNGDLLYGDHNGLVYLVRGPWTGAGEKPAGRSKAEFVSFNDADANLKYIAGQPSRVLFLNYGDAVESIAFAQQGQIIVAAGGNRIVLHDGRDLPPEELEALKVVRSYHAEKITSCVIPSGDSEYGYSADEEGRLVRWKIDVKAEKVALLPAAEDPKAPVTSVFYSPETRTVIAADQEGFVRRWPDALKTGAFERYYNGHAEHRDQQAWYVELPEPSVVTVAADNRACVWDVESGLLRRTIELGKRNVVSLAANGDRLIAATARYGRAKDASGNELDDEKFGAISFSLTDGAKEPLWELRPRVSAIHSFQRAGQRPVLAVGLRDGQVYLWREGGQREELIASSRRPLYRPVTCLWYDAKRDRLFAGDFMGAIAEFQLSDQGLVSVRSSQLPQSGQVRSLKVTSGEQLLAVQEDLQGIRATLCPLAELEGLKRRFEREQPQGDQGDRDTKEVFFPTELNAGLPEDETVSDVVLSPDGGTLIALAGKRLLVRPVNGEKWNPAPSAARLAESLNPGEQLTRVGCLPDGRVLAYGPGVVRLLTGLEAGDTVAFRARSRAPVGLVTKAANETGLAALTFQGSMIAWDNQAPEPEGRSKQSLLTHQGDALVSCEAHKAGQAYVARRAKAERGIVVELLDLATGNVLHEVCRVDRGTLRALSSEMGWVAMVIEQPDGRRDVDIYSPEGQLSKVSIEPELVKAVETPIQLAIGAGGAKLAMVTHAGATFSAYYAERQEDGRWGQLELVQQGASSVAFTPDGARLVVGGVQGQVSLLRLEATPAGLRKHNMLTLTGHTDRVSVVKFADGSGGLTLLSGDASGRVLLNMF